jgi:adenine phosphoribosyltransferase
MLKKYVSIQQDNIRVLELSDDLSVVSCSVAIPWQRTEEYRTNKLTTDGLPTTNLMDDLKKLIREVPDFPKPGINFYDITTLLKHPDGLRKTVDALAAEYEGEKVDTVIGVEARGFIFAPALAYHLGAGFVPVRKPKKLPAECASISYDLEYGQDTLEIHRDAVGSGHRVIIADDLLATGGTAKAVCDLVEELGGIVVGLVFVVELEFLPGRQKLAGYDVRSLIKYQS